jgi:TATA-binding protein-associated factor Taf7
MICPCPCSRTYSTSCSSVEAFNIPIGHFFTSMDSTNTHSSAAVKGSECEEDEDEDEDEEEEEEEDEEEDEDGRQYKRVKMRK